MEKIFIISFNLINFNACIRLKNSNIKDDCEYKEYMEKKENIQHYEFCKIDREVLHILHILRVTVNEEKRRVKEQPRRIDTLIDVMRVPFSWPRDRGVRFKYLDRPNSLEVTGALPEPSEERGRTGRTSNNIASSEYHTKGVEYSCLPILD
ncbi:hypothetical protein ALC53_08522 [Atta colombica]|uniref:Uncharacterized protein n=1 Tax=Atta colombica TaxID=520822 RepID=A0A195BAG2_9HYME|nr:hypothetical protein ALC53_08522 [Atta colombica]